MFAKHEIPAARAGVHTCRPRVLYRTGITNIELDALIAEIGVDRVMAALDRATQPELPLAAAE